MHVNRHCPRVEMPMPTQEVGLVMLMAANPPFILMAEAPSLSPTGLRINRLFLM